MREVHYPRWRGSVCALVAAGLTLGLPARGAAQTADPARSFPQVEPPRAPVIPLVLLSDRRDLTLMLSFTERDPPFAECVGACIVHVAPGTHWLRVRGPGVVEGERELDIEWPSRVKVQPRTEHGKRTGLTLGILGMALVGAGAALIFAGESGSDSGEGSVTLLGLASVASGAVLTPLGWVKYARTSPSVEIEALE